MTDGFRLVMTQGPEPGRTFAIDRDSIRIGRDPSNDVDIDHPQISRHHARLTLQGSVVVLEDLGSTNGTFVNGMRLTAPHTMANGDVISLGDAVTFTFYGQAAGAATVVTPPATVRTPAIPAAAYTPPPPPAAYAEPPRKRRTWLWVGCGCGALVGLALLLGGLYLMDQYFPHILYAPLRWLGF